MLICNENKILLYSCSFILNRRKLFVLQYKNKNKNTNCTIHLYTLDIDNESYFEIQVIYRMLKLNPITFENCPWDVLVTMFHPQGSIIPNWVIPHNSVIRKNFRVTIIVLYAICYMLYIIISHDVLCTQLIFKKHYHIAEIIAKSGHWLDVYWI